jgi:hypothetical protein
LRLDRLFAIKLCQLTARPAFSPEQLVEVGVNCLSIPVSARWMIKVMNQAAIMRLYPPEAKSLAEATGCPVAPE